MLRGTSANYDILRNIFCVAASRGKNEIIFVKSDCEPLNEHTLSTRLTSKRIDKADISTMFDFKFTEEIDKCLGFLDIKPVNHSNPHNMIEIPDADGLIDLTPCIGIYQEAMYFENYNMKEVLENAYRKRDFTPEDLSGSPTDLQILHLVALETHQNRYKYQVKLPFVTEKASAEIQKRLSEHLNRDDTVQVECHLDLNGIAVNGRCDVIHDNVIWELKFVKELKREHYLQLAMYIITLTGIDDTVSKTGCIWNTRDNTIFDVSIKKGKEKEFLEQVIRTVRKDTYTTSTRLSKPQSAAISQYRRPPAPNRYKDK